MTLIELAVDYGATRYAATLDALHRTVRSASNYDPNLDVMRTAGPLLEAGRGEEAVAAVRALMPGAFFSPAAHQALAAAHELIGDLNAAERERAIAGLAGEAILASGDGSREQPWVVLRVSDEYDVLRHLGLHADAQRLERADGLTLDRLTCNDGSELWFDLTLLEGVPTENDD
jgi:hypothetical protein